MDRLSSLEIFVAAVEEGSLAAAGRRFGLSASMAGKHVTALENMLKARLLQRSTRSLHLTDAGRAFHARARRILDEYDEASREAGDARSQVSGLIRIAAPVSFGTLHLGGVITAYLAAHPAVQAEVLFDDRYIDLAAAGVDVAVRIGILPDSALVARRLAPCRMTLCATPAFCRRFGPIAHPDDLRDAPLLAYSAAVSAGDWVLTDAAGHTAQIQGRQRLVANNMQMLLDAALAGIGIAYGPTFIFGPLLASGALVRLLPAWQLAELSIQAVYPSARHVPARVRGFIDCAIAAFGDVPPWDRPAAGA
jgi:DNA-binding transcriptional LysR family regulator